MSSSTPLGPPEPLGSPASSEPPVRCGKAPSSGRDGAFHGSAETDGSSPGRREDRALAEGAPDDLDRALSRVVDRADAPEDWATLDRAAARQPEVWDALLATLRDDAALRGAVAAATACAERVELAASAEPPEIAGHGTPAGGTAPGCPPHRRASAPSAAPRSLRRRDLWPARAHGLAGWAAAAVLAIGWAASEWAGSAPAARVGPDESLAATTEEAGEAAAVAAAAPPARVLGELARVVLQARPADDGRGFEVLYLRRRLERAVVPELYELGRDDSGAPVPMPIDPTALVSATRH